MQKKPFRIHPILGVLYHFFRILGWLGISVFYKKRLVLGREHFQITPPAIVVANHPSTLMDVLNAGTPIKKVMFFLANYGLFKHPVSRWFFSRLYCIPVKRKEDVEEGEARNNDAAFEASFEHLEKGGILFIAPEGVSYMNRWVREFKTGTARIALGAENRNNWDMNLKIIPIGISYNAPNLFRSEVVVWAGEPVAVRDWEAKYQGNPITAVEDLTLFIENRVRSLTVDARDETGELFVGQAEEILENSIPLSQKDAFFRSQQLAKKHLDNAQIKEDTAHYFEQLVQNGISDQGMALWNAPGQFWERIKDYLVLIAGFPLALVGYSFWFLPCYIPWLITKRLNLYIGYASNVKTITGIFTFPLAFWGAYRLAFHFLNNHVYAVLALLVLILLGYFIEFYVQTASRAVNRHRVSQLAAQNRTLASEILQKRNKILTGLSAL